MPDPLLTIWKYPLEITDEQAVDMPGGASVLSAQFQGGDLVVWAMVEPHAPRAARTIRIIGTGRPFFLPIGCRYVATVQHPVAPLAWHVFVDEVPAQSREAA